MSEIQKKLVDFIDKLAEDWDKLSGFIKFCLLIGGFILFAALIVGDSPHELLGVELSGWVYILLLFSFILILPLMYWTCERLYIWRVSMQYPIRHMGELFKFGQNGDAVCIIYEGKNRHIRWIENPTTLYDLGFLPYWAQNLHEKEARTLIKEGYVIRRGLRTRRKPGLLKKQDQ